MRNFFVLCLQLGGFVFTLGAIFAVLNYLTGWHLGFKGAAVPGEPAAVGAFTVLAVVSWALVFLLERKASS